MVQRDDFAVDQRIGQRLGCSRDGAELVGPVQPFAGQQRHVAILDPQLHAIAVELDLVAPAVRIRRPLDGGAKLRRDEIRHRGNLLRLGALRRRTRPGLRRGSQCRCFPAGARVGRIAAVRVPDRVGLCLALGQHERLWRLALALRDLRHRSPRGHGAILFQDVVGLAFLGEFVAVLDQEPVGALAAVAVALHPHQHPAAVQLVAMQREFQVALLEAAIGIIGFPGAAIPQHDGAAAILVVRDGAFEIAVVQRVILDLDREPLVVRIERGSSRHRPGFEDAVELQPQIVMQPGRVMLLDHEPPLSGRRDLDVAGGLRRLAEIALLPVRAEFLQRHGKPRPSPTARAAASGTKTHTSR